MVIIVKTASLLRPRDATKLQIAIKDIYMVGGVAQWLGCRSVAGGLSLICA